MWRLRATAYGLRDAPVAFSQTLNGYLVGGKGSPKMAGLRFAGSIFDLCSYFVFRAHGRAVGVMKTHIDEISGCTRRDVIDLARRNLERRLGFGLPWGYLTLRILVWKRPKGRISRQR